jgi:hypothetical protein
MTSKNTKSPRTDLARLASPSGTATESSGELPGNAEEDTSIRFAAAENTFCPFIPAKLGVYFDRFQLLTKSFEESPGQILDLVEAEFAWAKNQEGGPAVRDRYMASLSVLADLISQGWEWRRRDHRLELAPPDFTAPPENPKDIARQKAAIRESMRAERLAQMQLPSTRQFLEEMERPRNRDQVEFSILNLITNGEELARDLSSVQALSGDRKLEALHRVVQPYLQLVEGEDRCESTGYRLIDIWRYFRYHWSLPYFSTPGRNLFYLVRDAARPFHPVIGIAALGNSIIRLNDRDRWIGWSLESLERQFRGIPAGDEEKKSKHIADNLLGAIETAIDQIDARGLATPKELASPTDKLIRKLVDRAKSSAQDRIEKLRAHEEDLKKNRSTPGRLRPRDPTQSMYAAPARRKQVNLADESVEDLYKQKRASDLAELLHARRHFQIAGISSTPLQALNSLFASEDGRRGLGNALKAIKKQHIGTSMMDIIICGAIPPYTHLLGGKLVCMLLTSSQVRRDYHQRYSNLPSEIASKMKGEFVAKPAELVFLGTTSLYHVGSSQYNRVRIPASLFGREGEIRYEELGETRGYGSVHFSDRTRDLLEHIVREEKGATLITRTFGEGGNPKLRLVREGLGCIGVSQDRFLQHRCRRIIYGVALARNTREFLLGISKQPDYFFPGESSSASARCSAEISAYWAKRWLLQRIEKPEILERIATCSRSDIQMTRAADGAQDRPNLAGARSMGEPNGSKPIPEGGKATAFVPPPSSGPIGVAFIQRLYNHRSCYADRLSAEQLSAIHIETTLENFILDSVRSGRDVVLTGNPGDGKTHLIMRLLPSLNKLGAEHHADATAEESYEVILEAWKGSRKRKKAFCLAINEWPLLEFVRAYSDKFPVLKEVREQVEDGVVYSAAPKSPTKSVVVIDLNHRNLVAPEVFKKLVETLVSDRFYPECPRCPARETCDVPKARKTLSKTRVQDRLFALLELVTKQGHHITMRDLQGFVAFLITGGRSCEQLVAAQEPRPYYTLAFEGESDLFDAIRGTFDPARTTHPAYDEALWAGSLPKTGWLEQTATLAPPIAAPGDRIDAMRATKRKFYFEHSDGQSLLDLLPQDERLFYEALSAAPQQHERSLRELIRLLNRFFDHRDDTDSALRLWTRHCYDARWSPTYVSVRAIPAESFSLHIPRLPTTTTKAYPYQPDHLMLVAVQKDHVVARLRTDLDLYRTLFDAKRGLPMALRSPEVLKRLDLFFNELGRAFRQRHEIEDVHIKNFETGEDLRFKVDRSNQRYSL